jgi:short-subunit dehydrogenase
MFPSFQTVENTSDETMEKVMQTNFYSITYATQAFSALLFADKTGAIVNISSSAALCTIVGTAAYSASKSALKAYTEALALDKRDNYVGIIYPGTTKTELFRNDIQTENSALDKIAMPAHKMAKKILKNIRKRKKRAVVGWDAKLMHFVAKIAPVKGLFLIRYVMKKSKSKVFKKWFPNSKSDLSKLNSSKHCLELFDFI